MESRLDKIKILFLCTGNSCRSQMAEGMARHYKADAVEAYSAGITAKGLDPRAVIAMREIGIDISKQKSKSADELPDVKFDYVVTMCDNARETCPFYPGVNSSTPGSTTRRNSPPPQNRRRSDAALQAGEG